MARPIKDGVDYFPKDTDFYSDDKVRLLKAEFGAKGMFLLDYLLCELYRKNGYFLKWDDDVCLLVSEGAGCGCTPDFVREFVAGCVRRSFFDERVFNVFGVLTSQGIQRRYIRMIGNSRDEIRFISEYWLLDLNDKKDVPAGYRNKIVFLSLKSTENSVKSKENPVNNTGNAENKVEENKLNEIKLEEEILPQSKPKAYATSAVKAALIQKYSNDLVETYLKKATENYHYQGEKALQKVAEWLAADVASGKIKIKEKKQTSFDLDEYHQMVANFTPVYRKKSNGGG